MGKLISKASAGRSSKYRVPNRNTETGRAYTITGQNPDIKFSYIIKQIPIYKDMIYVSMPFDIYIFRKELHWFIFLRPSKSTSPFLTFEVTTDDSRNYLFARMDLLDDVLEKEFLKTENASLDQICELADDIKSKMDGYNMVNSNCQHFCNNILSWLGLPNYPTTTGMGNVFPKSNVAQEQLGFPWPVEDDNEKHQE